MKFRLAIVLMMLVNISFAQILFEHIKPENSWEMILKKAEVENKLIFVDSYAVWCGPCKFMERSIFADQAVGEYYNQHFINVSIDMETPVGKEFKKKYPVSAYPTLFYMNSKGEILRKKEGAITNPEDFIKTAQWVVSPEKSPLAVSTKKYEEGNRDKDFLIEHIGNMIDYNQDIRPIVAEYLKSVKPLSLEDEHTFSVFYLGVHDLKHELVKNFVLNNEKLMRLYTTKVIQTKTNDLIQRNIVLAVEKKDKKLLEELIDFVNKVVPENDANKKALINSLREYYKAETKK